jgi:glycerophosphoryl diester phosphodiesterase
MIELIDRVYNCAHRGASGRAPENTLAALELAADFGADMAEIDVQPTADGELVLLHDATLDRTTSGTGPVAGRVLADLRDLDAGSWRDARFAGERIPTLAEAIDRIRGRLTLNIELKTVGPHVGFLDRLRAVIRDADFADHCVVTSFDHALIGELVADRPDFALGLICGSAGLPAGVFRSRVELLSLEKSLIGPAEMEFALVSGHAVHAWTVNDKAHMKRLLDLGVGGIITDHPDRYPAPRPGAKGEPK